VATLRIKDVSTKAEVGRILQISQPPTETRMTNKIQASMTHADVTQR
jgi:hypothetical protein